jgi:hypothetical protein
MHKHIYPLNTKKHMRYQAGAWEREIEVMDEAE